MPRADSFMNVLGLLVGAAIVTTLVVHPATATIVGAAGNAFSHSLVAAEGR